MRVPQGRHVPGHALHPSSLPARERLGGARPAPHRPDWGAAAGHAPQPLYAPAPLYPEAARAAGLEGRVVVRLHVAVTGNVLEGHIAETTDTLFNRPTLDAVRHWRFRPARTGATPVAAWVSLPVRFSTQGVSSAEARPVAARHLPEGPERLTMDRRDAAPLRNPDGCRTVTAPVVPAPFGLDVRAARAFPEAVWRLGLWILVRGDGSIAETVVDSLDAPPSGAEAFVQAVDRSTRRLDRVVPARCNGAVVDAWYRGRYAYVLRPEGASLVVEGGRLQRVRPALVFAADQVFE